MDAATQRPDPDNNDGAVYKLAAEYMEETSFYNAY